MAVELIYETHATSTDNEAGIATGWLPGKLSATGRRQARELGERRRGGLAVVFSSDLLRAVDTARLAFAGTGLPYVQDGRLRECDYGELNGAPRVRIAAERPRRTDDPFPGGESYRDVVERVRAFLDDLLPEYDGRRVVVIGHAATRWALDHLLAGVPLEEAVGRVEWQDGWEYALRRE
jgi:broad specificity phosphatase PhoE